ncbi:MAG: YncE family protein [Flavitalea sp.]
MNKLLLLLACCISTIANAQPAPGYKITKTFPIASTGGWDYIAVHNHKLYVSHGTQVNILNETTGDSIGIITNTNGVHGIAFNDELNKGYTSNGRSNNVTVFDPITNTPLALIPTGKNPDAILYEPFTKTIITCNGRDASLSIIDPKNNTVITTIAVGGKPETAVSDEKGKLFVNIEDKNEIVEIDLTTKKVLHHWPLNGGEEPTGLAFDKPHQRLFAGCDKKLVVLNAQSGKIITQLPIGEGCDGVAFSNKDQTIFTSNGGDGTITAIKENTADNYSVIGNYPTKKRARTLILDDNNGTLFLPTAEFDETKIDNDRPMQIPGTFQVLVVEKMN